MTDAGGQKVSAGEASSIAEGFSTDEGPSDIPEEGVSLNHICLSACLKFNFFHLLFVSL